MANLAGAFPNTVKLSLAERMSRLLEEISRSNPSKASGKLRVMYLQYTNPAAYPPLQHSSRILANEGWEILFLGSGSRGADVLELPPHPNVCVKRVRFCPAGSRQKLHYVWFGLWVFLWTLRWRPRWIY